MAEDKSDPDFRAFAGISLHIVSDRPDLLLVELKTLQGPLRFSMLHLYEGLYAACDLSKLSLETVDSSVIRIPRNEYNSRNMNTHSEASRPEEWKGQPLTKLNAVTSLRVGR